MHKFFTDPIAYKALDKDGNDISTRFYDQYLQSYRSHDFLSIQQGFLSELSAFTWREESTPEQTILPNAVFTLTAEDFFYILDATTDHMPGKTFKMVYSISGTYAVADGYKEIMSCSNAVLNVESFDAGAYFSYALRDISTNSWISADHTSVTFSTSFKVDLSMQAPYPPGYIVWTETLGPYSGSVTGNAL